MVAAALSVPVALAEGVSEVAAGSVSPPYLLAMVAFSVASVSAVGLACRLWQRLRIAAWRGQLPGRVGALPDEQRESYDRPHGYKVARLVFDPSTGGGEFLGATVGGLYSRDSTAGCEVLAGRLPPPRRWGRRRVPAAHEVPDLGCTCGFHVFRDRRDATALLAARPPVSRLFGLVLLEVDLAGSVIEFERGFRASQQRVLGVQVPRWCLTCAWNGRAVRAERVAGLSGEAFEEACKADLPQHPPLYRLAMIVHYQGLIARLGERAALRAVCDKHTPATGGPEATVVLELADLAARLGTEVSWLDDGEFAIRTFVETMAALPPGATRIA